MTVEENIAFPLREAGERDQRVIEQKIAEMLEVIELEGQEKKMPVNLSGGMKKRVGLARAIINRPSCILYDEPTAGLDPVVSDSINRLIRRLQERYRVTSVVVTHDMKSAFHVGDHIAYLHEGRIYFYGTPAEIRASPDPLIQDFLIGRACPARTNEMNEQDRGLELKGGDFCRRSGSRSWRRWSCSSDGSAKGIKTYYDAHGPFRRRERIAQRLRCSARRRESRARLGRAAAR